MDKNVSIARKFRDLLDNEISVINFCDEQYLDTPSELVWVEKDNAPEVERAWKEWMKKCPFSDWNYDFLDYVEAFMDSTGKEYGFMYHDFTLNSYKP